MSKIKYEIPIIKDSIHKIIRNDIGSNSIFTTLQFGFYDNYGFKLPASIIRKYWDKTEVITTNRLIKNLLKEAFNISRFYFFMERHQPTLDKYGDVEQEGRFHIHLLTSGINDSAVLQPNRKCRRLSLYQESCNNINSNSVCEYKIRLFDECCKQANWINRYSYSIKTSVNKTNTDLRNRTHYCLKHYKHDELDFMDIIDFDNSDFNKHTIQQLKGEQLCGTALTKRYQENYA